MIEDEQYEPSILILEVFVCSQWFIAIPNGGERRIANGVMRRALAAQPVKGAAWEGAVTPSPP